ncbi:MAG: NAD(P)H-dependent oxidoreductase [Pseudobdellovibrionaceae bacterium]
MRSALILLAHPAYHRSRVHHMMIEAVKDMKNVTIHDLYETYPDFHLNLPRERELLLNHDMLVLQHPFYWFSAPALMKEWCDLVLTYGWAYGPDGGKLEGKTLMSAVTTGGPHKALQKSEDPLYSPHELLAPFHKMAHICHMRYADPHILEYSNRADQQTVVKHATAYCQRLQDFIDGKDCCGFPYVKNTSEKAS